MSNKLLGAEIFSTGTHNGLTFNDADLDVIVDAFAKLGSASQVPLKFGHNAEQDITDGQPALGWVQRVWKDGSKLFADFVDVPTVVFEAVKKGLYKKVSVELLKNFNRDGASFPWVLEAVALLGADKPAVRGLKDLQALAMTSKVAGSTFASVATFTLDSLIGVIKMTEEEMKAKIALAEKAAADSKAALEAITTAHFKEKVEAHRTAIKSRLELCVTEGRIQPRVRDRVLNSVYFKDDAQVLTAYTLESLESEIKENQVANFTEKKGVTSKDKADTADMTDKRNDEVLTFKAQAECLRVGGKVDNHDDMVAATQRVLREDKVFAKAYFNSPDELFKA